MSDANLIRLGTRGSRLARWQAQWTAARLEATGARVEIILIQTSGDVQSGPIGLLGAQGLFTKEIQNALLDGRVDLAVHSLKDLPTDPTPGLILAAVPEREKTSDMFLSTVATDVVSLPEAAHVGTGSTRRRSQLLHVRPDLQIGDLRGNVETRVAKLAAGECDAIILAEAGLTRLEMLDNLPEGVIATRLPNSIMFPAVGQGALGLETRSDDARTREIVGRLNDPSAYGAVIAERTMLATLHGGCLAPIGALASINDAGLLQLTGVVLSKDGTERLEAAATDRLENAPQLGQTVAQRLLEQGAAELIATCR